jgi:carbonic anhydrase/acetyltransferase-like protein (isoleucine patch superfamily)
MNIRSYKNIKPDIGQRVYIDPQATVIGHVSIGDDSSIWPGTVVRGDVNRISIGQRSNIQDNSTIHVTHDSHYLPGGYPTTVGDDVTVGHQVILHACTIGSRCLIGMGSLIMDNVTIADDVMVGAGSLVTQNTSLPSGYLYLGRPAKQIRQLSEEELQRLVYSAQHYVRVKDHYLSG